jgi:hypothetical protein
MGKEKSCLVRKGFGRLYCPEDEWAIGGFLSRWRTGCCFCSEIALWEACKSI